MEPLALGPPVRLDLVFSVPPPSVLPASGVGYQTDLRRPARKALSLIMWSSVSGVH